MPRFRVVQRAIKDTVDAVAIPAERGEGGAMSDVLYSDMNITVEEERTGLRHLFGIGFELPVPPEQTRKLAGYIARKMSDYDALAAQHAQELSELAASKHLFAELTDRKNDLEARLEEASVPAPHPAPEPEESPELAQAVEQSENKQDCPSRLGDVVERLSNFPEPVEQGEQPEITNQIEIAWRKGFVCAGPFIRENVRWTPDQADQFADYLRSAAQSAREQTTSSSAPSEPELPPLPNPITTSKYWDAGIDRPLAGERAARLERQDQLLAALREIQQLRQRCEELAAKELVVRQQQQRLSNLSNDATADQKAFAHIHKILDEAQVPRSQKIEGQKHSVWLTTPRRVEWLVENIAARSMRLDEAVQDAVARNIDLVKYNGKTIREWIVLSNTLQQQLAQKAERIAELEGGQ